MGEAAFRTEVATIPDVPDAGTVRIGGRITYREAPELRKTILDAIRRTSAARLVLALGGVEEMDTSGAAVLAEALKVGQNRGLHVLLCSPSESVMRIFALAGFDDVLEQCCPTPAETQRRLLQ